jgi:hypothetical protein
MESSRPARRKTPWFNVSMILRNRGGAATALVKNLSTRSRLFPLPSGHGSVTVGILRRLWVRSESQDFNWHRRLKSHARPTT